jgi:radical SAM protein with 4Fe4S-binding SPASM domain
MRQSGFAFDPDGHLLPCNHFVDSNMGKFGDDFSTADEFRELLRRPDIREFYETVNMAPCHECAKCARWNKCGGGCRIFWLYAGHNKLVK